MNSIKFGTLIVTSLVFYTPAYGKTYIEEWDEFAIKSTTGYWEWIKKTESKSNNTNTILNDVKIEVIPHSSTESNCLALSGLAHTEIVGDKKTIKICARQLRFILHLLDALTTIAMITSGNKEDIEIALSTKDAKKIEKMSLEPSLFLHYYSEYLRIKVKKDILIIGNSQHQPFNACSADFFYMKMIMKQDYMNCDINEQFKKQKEFDTWYYSPGGIGWIFSQSAKKELGSDIDKTQVKEFWNFLHNEVNKSAIIFILLHEAGHIVNGDLATHSRKRDMIDDEAESHADLWATKKMMEMNVISAPHLLPFILRTIILNVRYFKEYDPKNPSAKPSNSTEYRINKYDRQLSEIIDKMYGKGASRVFR